MNRVEIDSKRLIELMSNRNILIGQGSLGVLLPYNEQELIKIYYKMIFDGYYYLDEIKLIKEIEMRKEVDLEMKTMFSNYKDLLLLSEKKIDVLESIGLINAGVFCNGYKIGILLNNLNDYCVLENIFDELSIHEKKFVIEKIEQYLYYLILNNIYPRDIKENSVMLRRSDFDIRIIDLDEQETRYEEKSYIENHPFIETDCFDSFRRMCLRLTR